VLDLHNHTTASDGVLSPAKLIERAHEKGITGIAVTDHDSLAGLSVAGERGRALGVDVFGGIEISATLNGGRSLHILGYCFDLESSALNSAIQKLRAGRSGRNERICEKLTDLGMPIKIEEVQAIADGTVGRPHFARIMVEKGYVNEPLIAFEKWLGTGCPAFVDKEVLSPAQAIAAIHDAGGIAVLAHPLTYAKDAKKLEDFIAKLAAVGLDGMEVYYGAYSPGEIIMLRCLADRFKLLPGGGSDFHYDPHPLGPIFPRDVTARWTEILVPLAAVGGAGNV